MHLFPPAIVDLAAATTDRLLLPGMAARGIEAAILRLDQIHPVVSGNKWFKLKYHLQEALKDHYRSLVTFGGAYSNHIVATAYTARETGLSCTGIIRGEAPVVLSHTLRDAMAYGMQLQFVSRDNYTTISNSCHEQFPGHYYIPEGGAGSLGEKGCYEIMELVPDKESYTHILCAIGTATMFLGLVNSTGSHQQVIGIPVLKGMEQLMEQRKVRIHPGRFAHCRLFHDYHFGGYAKKNNQLFTFMNHFYEQTGIPTDFVYTGKLLFAVNDLVNRDYFPPGSRLLVIHSGGLQGNLSLPLKTLRF